MPHRTDPLFAADFTDPQTARAMAQEIADAVGHDIVITDKNGNEVFKARPTRLNERVLVPKLFN